MTDFLRWVFPGLPVSKEKQVAQELMKALKGGPGSGNFGHAGRPGEVGGSAGDSNYAVHESIQGIIDNPEYYSLSYEKLIITDSEGNIISSKNGNSSSIRLSDNDYDAMDDNYFIHNHPPEPTVSFSPQDIKAAEYGNAKTVIVTGKTATYILTRPPDGWPKDNNRLIARAMRKSGIVMKKNNFIGVNSYSEVEPLLDNMWNKYAELSGSNYRKLARNG